MRRVDDSPVVPLEPGDELGPYRIHRQLRSPPGTELYQAGDKANPEESLVRLEVYVPELEEAEYFHTRWDEASLFTKFEHPSVLRLRFMGNVGRRYYAVLPWISARSLLACLEDERSRPWPLDAALTLVRDVALGLGALHRWTLGGDAMNVVYRAVSPETVLISARGRGLLRPVPLVEGLLPARPGTLRRLHHLAPEAVRGLRLTPASDVASLGSLLYRLLTGIHPYRAATDIQILKLILEGRYPPLAAMWPGLPPSLDQLIQRMMSVTPSERPANGDALVQELHDVAAEAGVELGPPAIRKARRLMAQGWE